VINQDLDAFLFGVLQLPGRSFEEPARAARHHFDVFSTETATGPAAIHGRVTDADDQHVFADGIGVAEGDGFQPIDTDMDAIGVMTAGDVELFSARRSRADKDRIEALAEQRPHAMNGRVVSNLNSHVEDLVDLVHENAFGQAEGGNVGAHQSAGPVVLFEEDNFVAQRHQVVRDRERGRSRADTCDALSVFLAGDLGKTIGDVVAQIGRHALQAANGDGLAIHAATAAGRLARAIAGAAENRREHVRLPVEHVGIGIAALRDEANVFGNVSVGRTGPLTVHNFVEVVRVADVRGVHTWILSVSTTVTNTLEISESVWIYCTSSDVGRHEPQAVWLVNVRRLQRTASVLTWS